MKQIYNVKVDYRERWVMDDKEGAVLRRERVTQPADTVEIVHAGKHYGLRSDGTFWLPDEAADHFLRQPGWLEGASPFAVKGETTETIDEVPPVRKVGRPRKEEAAV